MRIQCIGIPLIEYLSPPLADWCLLDFVRSDIGCFLSANDVGGLLGVDNVDGCLFSVDHFLNINLVLDDLN